MLVSTTSILTSTTQQQLLNPKHKGKQKTKPKHNWMRMTPIAELQQQQPDRGEKSLTRLTEQKLVRSELI
jgi:hypothetical protein